MKNNLAYICSPYRGNFIKRIRNRIYARRLTRIAANMGYAPITTHLYLTQVFNDSNPRERRQGMNAGKDILLNCNTIIIGARYGVSQGMESEIAAAAGKRIIIIV